nr:acyltransferase [Nocardioides flavescens]
MVWPDVAKGACIVLVVLWHVTRKDYLQLDWRLDLPVTGAWGTLSQALLPVRMPLFFAISGFFAARRLERPWRSVLARRVAPLLWVFVLWTLLQTAVLQAVPGFDTAIARTPAELAEQLTVTPGNLWYLLALAAYVAVARATRRRPVLALAAALALSAVAAAGWVPTPGNRYGLLTNLPFFLLGVQLARHPDVVRRHATPARGAALVAAYVVGAGLWILLDADTWLGVRPGLGLLGAGAGAVLAVTLSRVPAVGAALATLGRRTLPVYVVHLPLVAFVHLASARLVPTGSTVVAVVYPLLVTALVLAASLALHRLAVRLGGRWLFEAPWLRPGRRPAPEAVGAAS